MSTPAISTPWRRLLGAALLCAAPLLAWGRWVTPIALVFSVIYACGLWLVHAPAGWFVVGLGRNGMEYSVLILACLLANAWAHRDEWRRK